MFKKALLGVTVVGLSGVLVVGAVNRTAAKASQTAAGDDQGRHGQRVDSVEGTALTNVERGGYWGGQDQSAGRGQDAGQGGAASIAGNGGGTGQAEVEAWLTLQGAVASVDADALTVALDDGGAMIVEGRAWSFAQAQGFWAQAGDAVALTGFYDGDKFEAGQISNLTSGQSLPLRDDAGRPLWAGRGRRGGV
ncbi:MAG: hypothetical protein Kow00120_13140 [Anaerolineae bacterium]